MGDLLHCPVDGTPLVMIPDEGIAETTCHQCKRTFEFVRGRLTDIDLTSIDEHHAKLAVSVEADGEVVHVEHPIIQSRWTALKTGAPATLVVQHGRGGARRLVEVRTARQKVQPAEPGDRAAIRTVGTAVQGSIVLIFAVVLAMYFYHWAWVFALIPGALIVTGLAVFRWRRSSERQRVDPLKRKQLEREQWLLAQLDRYRLQQADVVGRVERYEKQIRQMRGLLADMKGATGDYQHRTEVVQRGLETLRHHVENDRKLQGAIAQAMETVEIEYKASRALDHLPDDAIDRLTHTIAELDAIQEENQMLEAQLEANAEVNAIAPN